MGEKGKGSKLGKAEETERRFQAKKRIGRMSGFCKLCSYKQVVEQIRRREFDIGTDWGRNQPKLDGQSYGTPKKEQKRNPREVDQVQQNRQWLKDVGSSFRKAKVRIHPPSSDTQMITLIGPNVIQERAVHLKNHFAIAKKVCILTPLLKEEFCATDGESSPFQEKNGIICLVFPLWQ